MKRTLLAILAAVTLGLGLAGCNDADVASRNLSTAADNFQIARRVTFINGITGQAMLTVEGLCSLGSGKGGVGQSVNAVTVTCKRRDGTFVKDYMGVSDNVTFVAEQLDPAQVSTVRYKLVIKPSVLIPDVQVK